MRAHTDLTEAKLEEYIENHLLNNQYIKSEPKDFNKEFAFDTKKLFEFLEKTQLQKLEKLREKYNDNYYKKILERISKEINNRGVIDVLRHGISDLGVKLDLAYFQPNSTMNEDLMDLYNKNILSITRQLKYSKKSENSIDIVIFLNGFPVIAIELKNEFTGQNVENGKYQFRQDRDPTELLFQYKKRLLAYFVADTSQVYMTTRLAREKTYFLPFNKGNQEGAGNPLVENGLKTGYFWKEILHKDSLMDIIKRFYFIQIEEEKMENGDINKKETAIFPRYHQLDVVRKIEKDILINGLNQNYLIQHSAGSGKTNSISWLAHRLANLHSNDENVFDTVIVITDRKVLDNQLQKAIYQLEHKHGVVQKIDKDSQQLATAMQKGTKIVITTLQKFPFILEKIEELKKKKYAVIVDEAHSSTAGENMSSLKEVLAGKTLEESEKIQQELEENEIDIDEKIAEIVSKVADRKNMSFFAFTATPKAKTLEMFGRKDNQNIPHAFHVYSMKQAIEEGFILDVLKNYMTYKTYYNVNKKIEANPEFEKSKASKAITRFVSLHNHNISQKVEIIVEDFINNRKHWLNNKAKAMIVTSSRKHAVRYKIAIDQYLKKKNYSIKTLIAFSGTVEDDGLEYTESGMNSFKESELPKKFKTDEYSVLIVAEKYQTGFDEPLLSVMYVDKKLSDVKAVQTLSRLNRTTKGKDSTFILDFQNDAEDIVKAFAPFFKTTEVDSEFDPNLVYDIQYQLKAFGIYLDDEIEDFTQYFFSSKESKNTKKNIEGMNSLIDIAEGRFKKITEEEQEDFKSKAVKFVRLYNFVVLVASVEDIELYKLYVYLTHLIKKLPKKNSSEKVKIEDKVDLVFYKIVKTFGGEKEGKSLNIFDNKEEYKLMPPTFMGNSSKDEEQKEPLEIIINTLNEKFGTNFDKNTDLVLKQVQNDCFNNISLKKQAKVNTLDDFKLSFKNVFMDIVIDRMDSNQGFFMKMLSDDAFKNTMINYMVPIIYDNLRELE